MQQCTFHNFIRICIYSINTCQFCLIPSDYWKYSVLSVMCVLHNIPRNLKLVIILRIFTISRKEECYSSMRNVSYTFLIAFQKDFDELGSIVPDFTHNCNVNPIIMQETYVFSAKLSNFR